MNIKVAAFSVSEKSSNTQKWYMYLFHIFKEHNMNGIIWIVFHNTLPVQDVVKPAIGFNWKNNNRQTLLSRDMWFPSLC